MPARWNVRCSKETCKLRYVFPKHPDEYIKPRICVGCGGTRFRVDKDRMAGEKRPLCNCAGYPHMSAKGAPHHRGSFWCWYRLDGTQRMPGDPDFHDKEYDEHCDASTLL